MGKFYLEDYIREDLQNEYRILSEEDIEKEFMKLCKDINEEFDKEWNSETQNMADILDIQKKAIIGYEKETAYFKDKINEYLKSTSQENARFPAYYNSLADAVYHQNWGLAGMAEWFNEEYRQSSSAKIIGDRIYFMENGRMVLKNQKISQERREQFVRALMLRTPEERMDKDFHELYLLDGTRITVYSDNLTKKNQDAIIFRRYIVPDYSFEEQARRHTIPPEAINIFKNMVKIGYNTAFVGAVRSAKSTFLSTWQSYENPELEGVLIETDPEIPLHIIMKNSPIIQIVADNERLMNVSKNLLRSDADYFILAEARDGVALDMAVRIANKGSRRMKMTFHCSDPQDFCYDAAVEIARKYNVDIESTMKKVAKSFHYIFHFVQLQDKSQKRLKGIYEVCPDENNGQISVVRICKYNYDTDDWSFYYHMGADKKIIGYEEDISAFNRFDSLLKSLAEGVADESE